MPAAGGFLLVRYINGIAGYRRGLHVSEYVVYHMTSLFFSE